MRNTLTLLSATLLSLSPALARQADPSPAGSLYIWVNPSKRLIDWSSPHRLLVSTAGSESDALLGSFGPGGRESALGHMLVHFECTDSSGQLQDSWSGMTGQNDPSEDKQDFLKDQIGFGVLFKNYADGQLYGNDISRNSVINHMGRITTPLLDGLVLLDKLDPVFFKVPVTTANCDQMVEYVNEFKRRSYEGQMSRSEWIKKPVSDRLFYGNPIKEPWTNYQKYKAGDMNALLGGGCTAYATSFLKMVGRWHPVFEDLWLRSLDISERLIGGIPDAKTGKTRSVPVTDIVLSPTGLSWEHSGYKDRTTQVYDPEQFHDFVVGAQACADALASGNLKESHLPSGCTPKILNWVREQGDNINFHDTVEFEKKDKLGFTKKVVRKGIEFRN